MVVGVQAKVREQDEIQKKGVNRLRELYKEQNTRKLPIVQDYLNSGD